MVKLIAILLIALTFETAGVILLSKGLKELEPPQGYQPAELARLIGRGFTSPAIVLGVACEAVFFAGLLMMMSRADVSFVWPLTSLTFVFSTVAAKVYLQEQVSPLRWTGVVLIVCGAGLITCSEKAKERRRPQPAGEPAMPFRQVTLKEVAAKAGVSIMTASRALRNQANVTSETRAKVERAAAQLQYRPNPLVSALMSYRRASRVIRDTLTLGLVTNFTTRDGWRTAKINQDFFSGATQACSRHGYKLDEFWLREPDMTARRMSSILYSRNINGLLIAPLPVALGHLRLDWENFSAVALGYSLAWPRLHRAVNHQFRSIRMALRRLRKMGYHRIGLALKSGIDERVEHHYSGGFMVEQQRVAANVRLPMHVVPDRQWNEKAFAKWFEKYQPEVVVSHHEEVLEWLARLGLKVPADLGYVHLNLPECTGRMAGIYQNGPAVGTAAVDFLVAMLQRNERGIPSLSHSILVEGTWVDGATLVSRTPLIKQP